MRRHAVIAAILSATCSVVAAQTIVPKLDDQSHKGDMARKAKDKAKASFEALDTDKDDRLSREEVAALRYLSENFDKRDLDKSGFLSWEEYVGHDRWQK